MKMKMIQVNLVNHDRCNTSSRVFASLAPRDCKAANASRTCKSSYIAVIYICKIAVGKHSGVNTTIAYENMPILQTDFMAILACKASAAVADCGQTSRMV
jgi:hypothetical protein